MLIIRSAGFTQLFPGAHLANTNISKFNFLNMHTDAHLTDSNVLRWSVSPSLNFIKTFGK